MLKHLKFFLLALALLGAAAPAPVQAATITALEYPSNDEAGSDIRLVWADGDLLPRDEHTAIWRYNPAQQTGYYALAWHTPNTGSWDFGEYSMGTHPYPAADCVTEVSPNPGKETTGNGSIGTHHCWEVAGAGAAIDWLLPASQAGNTGYTVVKSKWYTQVRRSQLATSGECDGEYESLYIPDYDDNPTQIIRHCQASIGSPSGGDPAFYFGASDWTSNSGANNETPSGKLRGIQLYDAALSDADIALEVANLTSNTPVTAAGIANVWYMNQNPTVADVTDKSGAGHDPVWANANRPADWDSTISAGTYRACAGAGR